MRTLHSQQEVIDALGGINKFRDVLGANRKQAWHWTGRTGLFPAYTYPPIQKALRRRGLSAADELFAQRRRSAA
jgi:hypothetical protein